MRKTILAARLQQAIEKIQEKTGIDVSPSQFGRMPDVNHLQLAQLEKIADEIDIQEVLDDQEQSYTFDEVMIILSRIDGFGEKTIEKITNALMGE